MCRSAFDTTCIHWKYNDLLCLHTIIRPHAIGLAQNGLFAVVLDTDSSKRVLRSDFMNVN